MGVQLCQSTLGPSRGCRGMVTFRLECILALPAHAYVIERDTAAFRSLYAQVKPQPQPLALAVEEPLRTQCAPVPSARLTASRTPTEKEDYCRNPGGGAPPLA
jgi:hypothetical protein